MKGKWETLLFWKRIKLNKKDVYNLAVRLSESTLDFTNPLCIFSDFNFFYCRTLYVTV